jgi:hypothetical protein
MLKIHQRWRERNASQTAEAARRPVKSFDISEELPLDFALRALRSAENPAITVAAMDAYEAMVLACAPTVLKPC